MAVSREQNDHPLVPHRARLVRRDLDAAAPFDNSIDGRLAHQTSRAWSRHTDYVDRRRR
jgi:hypothetical protein